MANSPHLIVIGAGPGGYATAFMASDQGLDVTLIDDAPNPGGVCLYRGCIPSKALLHVARLLQETKLAREWGVRFNKPIIDLDELRSWKDGVVGKMTKGLGALSRQRKINYIQGRAKFIGPHQLIVTRDRQQQNIRFDKAVVATGSRPARISSLWIKSEHLMDSTGALEIPTIPSSLLVIGGGYIGLEIGSVYSALGSQVTMVEVLPELLPGADSDLTKLLRRKASTHFSKILLNSKVESLVDNSTGIEAKIISPDGMIDRTFDKVLMSVGRTPNTDQLGLEKLGIVCTSNGYIPVDVQRQTSCPGVFAVGDVAGEPCLAHKATHEGRTVAESVAGLKVAFEPQAIPSVVFTDPEVAWCGLTEDLARAQGRDVSILRFPWTASGRANTMGSQDTGLTKLIIDPSNERVLGMGVVGSGAGELIAEGVLAVEMGAMATDLRLSIHPHPTLSETVMEAADLFFGQSTHIYRPKK